MLVRLDGETNVVLQTRIHISRAVSCVAYDGPVVDLVRSMKFSGRLDIVRYMARRISERMDRLGHLDAVVSVPAEPSRVVARGFDSSLLIARSISGIASVPCLRGVLVRVRSVRPQVGLPRDEREKNVKGAFAVDGQRARSIEGLRLLVVDDVMTTGATLNDCSRALVKAGAKEVCALAFARTL